MDKESDTIPQLQGQTPKVPVMIAGAFFGGAVVGAGLIAVAAWIRAIIRRRHDSPGPGHDSPYCYAPFPTMHENSGSSSLGVITLTTPNQPPKPPIVRMAYDNNRSPSGLPVSDTPLEHEVGGTTNSPRVPHQRIKASCSAPEICPAYTELYPADPTVTIQRHADSSSSQPIPGLRSQGNTRGSVATMYTNPSTRLTNLGTVSSLPGQGHLVAEGRSRNLECQTEGSINPGGLA